MRSMVASCSNAFWTTALPYLGGCLGEEGSASICVSARISHRLIRSYCITTPAARPKPQPRREIHRTRN
uniref:Uncharacterized protein n=1 Tax=Arundo donax TaxID=35708 RepID=A0A0A9FDR4_ARUDO